MAKYNAYPYQKYCEDRIVNDPAVALFLDMGLGKTTITLHAIKRLRYEYFKIKKVLVVAPKQVATSTWHREAAEWDDLSLLRCSVVVGSQAQRLRALEATADVYIINRENVVWLVEHYMHAWPFDMVVLDESSSFKNHRAKRFRALRMIRPRIKRIVELTGTPSPRSLMDLWAQIYLLDMGKRLGKTITSYRDAYFTPGRRNRTIIYDYNLKPGAESTIHNAISDICVSMKAADYLDLPELIIEDIPVELDAKARKAYTTFERDALLEVDEDLITANNAAAVSGKLLQMCNGAVYSEDGEVINVHNCKIDALLETIEQLNGQHALICYNFKHDLTRILEVMPKTGLRYAVYNSDKELTAWNSGELDLLLVQPVSCGYGLNLQQGGYHCIWFGLTFDAEIYLQANKRLHRQGQKHPVIVHNLVVQNARDVDAIQSLKAKDKTQNDLLESLKARIRKVKKELTAQ